MAETKLAFQLGSGLATGHLTDAKYTQGTYTSVATIEERDALVKKTDASDGTIVKGSLVYVQADDKIYKYDGTEYVEFSAGGMDNALLQFEETPTDENIKVFQYIGENDTDFTENHIYELKEVGDIYKCYVFDRDAAAHADPGTYGYHYLYIKNDNASTFYGKIDGTNAIKVSSVDNLEVLTIALVQQSVIEYDDSHITFDNGAGTAYRNDDSNDLTGNIQEKWCDLYSGSSAIDIVTEWGETPSNEKVPSEKLVFEHAADTYYEGETGSRTQTKIVARYVYEEVNEEKYYNIVWKNTYSYIEYYYDNPTNVAETVWVKDGKLYYKTANDTTTQEAREADYGDAIVQEATNFGYNPALNILFSKIGAMNVTVVVENTAKTIREKIETIAIQVTELPTITSDNEDKVYQYVGITNGTYTKGHFYQVGNRIKKIRCYGTSPSCCYVYENDTEIYCKEGHIFESVTSEAELALKEDIIPVVYFPDEDVCKSMPDQATVYDRYIAGDLASETQTVKSWVEVNMGGGSSTPIVSTDDGNAIVEGNDGGAYLEVTSIYSSTGIYPVNGKAVASAISDKANTSALGTQVTYTLSGTTLYINTK